MNAQDLPNFSQFFFNPSLLNPSFIGIDGQSSAYLAYRKQWVGIPGAPVSSNFNIQAPTGRGVGMGFTVQNDTRGLLSTTSAMVSGSYNLPLEKGAYLRFGMSVGAGSNKTDIEQLRFSSNPSDQVLASLVQSDIQILGNAGISYHNPMFHIGLALPNIFQPTYLNTTPFSVAPLKPLSQVVLHGSYRYYFSRDKNLIEPYFNYRINAGMPGQFELATVVHLSGLLWFGGSYRQGFGPSGMAGFNLGQQMAVGYSYSLGTLTSDFGRPGHEVQLGFLFGKPVKKAPVFSFVHADKSKKKSTVTVVHKKKKPVPKGPDLARKGPAKVPNTGGIKAPVKQPVKAQPTTPAVVTTPPKTEPKQPAVTQEPAPKKDETLLPTGNNVPISAEPQEGEDAESRHGVSHMEDLQEEGERMGRLEQHKENPREAHVGEARNADRHEFVKRGNHQEEMSLGNYVIVGVFKGRANAEKYANGLKSMGFSDIDFGFLSEREVWYVHFNERASLDQAKAIRDRERQIKVFRDAWLLTVQ